MKNRTYVALSLLALSAVGRAQIEYRVRFDRAEDQLQITLAFTPKSTKTVLQLPSWSPGLYVREDYWKTLNDLKAEDENQQPLEITHPKGDTWEVTTNSAKKVTVRYSRKVDRSNSRIGMFASSGKAIHYTGPSTYLYLVDRKNEPCTLTLFPTDTKAAVGLAQKGDVYQAPNYDELADATVTFGEYIEWKYQVGDKEYTLAVRGPNAAKLEKDKVVQLARFISKSTTDFFHAAPYPKYVWHVMAVPFGDNAGGVEHLNGTDIFLGNKIGRGALRGMAHEFFHLFNVKRIREEALGPFDYTQLPKAGALWWLEGVTDYYASIIPYRAQGMDEADLLRHVTETTAEVRSNKARLEVSPFESGDRTPESSSNSSGYRVNYYPTGWLLGLMFDIELRSRTKGKHSLDDVERALWNLCKDGKPGFKKDEIRKQLVHFGGAPMGQLYDAWVMQPGDLPIEATLAKAGLLLNEKGVTRNPQATPAQKKTLEAWLHQAPLPKEYRLSLER